MTYHRLLEVTAPNPTHLAEPPSFLVGDEMEIQSHWFAGHFKETHRSNHGNTVVIVSPGEWNRGPGPDFINATIEIDGETRHGPIEIDLDARNWERHGHHESPYFNEVILHVVLEDSGPTFFTRTLNHCDVPRIVLHSDEVNAALGRPRLTQALARPGRCLRPLAGMGEEDLTDLLKQAALHRASLKARRFKKTERLHHFSQALWETFAEALGYSSNRLPMRLLAQRLPIQRLLKHPPDDRTAILFGTAGFLSPTLHEQAPPPSRTWVENLWNRWWKHRDVYEFPSDRLPSWSARSTRPGNHPQRRLGALAVAATKWPSLCALARQAPPFERFCEAISSLEDPFWSHHHTLLSKPLSKSMKLVGESRLQDFLVNALYPLHLDDWDRYAKVRAKAPNQKVKRCCERLFGSLERARPNLKFAWQHQALLQLYQDFCLEDLSDCTACPFPEQLARWTPIHHD